MSQQVSLGQLKQGPHQFPPFPPVVRDQIRWIQETFQEVCPDSVDEWEDGFRRDAHPIREIEIWKAMAVVYRRFADQGERSRGHNEDVWRVLLVACTVGPAPETAIEAGKVRTLSQDEVETIIEAYQKVLAER